MRTTDGKRYNLSRRPYARLCNFLPGARAELRAVQDAALRLAVLMARFGQDAEHIAALLHELDAPA